MKTLAFLTLAAAVAASAQQTHERVPYLRATGKGIVSVKPDQAKVTFGVTTQGTTAADAAQKNADLATKVQAELRKTLGANAALRTTGFNVSPNYRSGPNQAPTIVGYEATNAVEITIDDVAQVGKTIDSGVKAGANNVRGVQFSLKDPAPKHAEALQAAAKHARTQAEAIARGLGGRTGRVLSAVDSVISSPGPIMPMAKMAMSASTPVESGELEVRATVTIEVEYVPAQ